MSYSFTFLLHMIPAANETFTRLPVGSPLFTGPDDPALQKTVGVFFLLFFVGAGTQMYRIWSARRGMAISRVSPV